jgi:hypothetical protein
MYPADGLGDTYDEDDLPDTVYAKWQSRIDGTMAKSGSGYESGTVVIRRNSTNTAWEFYDSDDDATRTIGNCLIRGDGGLTPEDDTVEDRFEDIYTLRIMIPDIEFSSPADNISPIDITLSRTSLCVWSGGAAYSQSDWVVSASMRYLSGSNVWRINVTIDYEQNPDDEECGFCFSDVGTKTELSSPVGDYDLFDPIVEELEILPP